ncbi:MAG: outer membrane beta-barrel family protein, partial [Bacteroidales bacterium]|nr:outer membrane beta-barrel family protein [Bacteroidales bacterium]
SDKHKIEAGYKGEISDEDSPVETYSGTSIETIAFDTLLYNRFIYNRNVHALYATYAGRVGNFGYSAGLRGEYTGIRTKSLAYDDEYDDVDLYKIDYYSLFPSLYLTYSLPKGNEIQLNYTRRISRPRGHQLNSFVDLTDTLNISFGNPELKPQFSHALELNYIKSWEKHTISFSAYYRQEENVIQRIRYRDGLVMKSTFENITQSQATGAELVVKNSLFKILDLTTTLNAYYSQLDGFSYYPNGDTSLDPVVGESSHGFSWDAKMIANFALPYSMSLQITGRYNSPSIVAQGKRDANYALDAGFKKSFFNRRLSLSLSARDILDSRKWHTYTYGDGFIQDYCGWRGGREFRLTATWSFGNMKSNKKPSATGTSESMNTGYEDDSMGY